jgi:hypothetical protein
MYVGCCVAAFPIWKLYHRIVGAQHHRYRFVISLKETNWTVFGRIRSIDVKRLIHHESEYIWKEFCLSYDSA